jgi:uncharacterized protein (UPF0548 family)
VTSQPRLRARLAKLADVPVNYDAASLDLAHPAPGWDVDDLRQPLVTEPPGEPVPGGSFEIAGQLIRGYEFADPSLVRATYDPDSPLLGRDMLLELRALGLISIHVGVRIVSVDDEPRTVDGRPVRVFGWAYRTLQGHVEQGQMEWHVWKWLDTGEVEFRVHAVSRIASIPNPVVWIGFHLLHNYERKLFLSSTERRMRELVARAVGDDDSPADSVRKQSPLLTARHSDAADPAHGTLADRLED